MSAINLFIDIDRSEPVAGKTEPSIVPLPRFIQGDSLLLRIWLLTGRSRVSSYSYVPVAGITLEAALGVKVGNATTYYTQQFTWTASEDLAQPYFEAVFPMNTDAITTLIGSAEQDQAWFEVKMIQDGTPITVLSKLVTVHASVIKEAGITVPAGLTPLSAEAAAASFVRVIHTGSFDLMNSNGKGCRLYVDDDGVFRADPIS